jgi:hypothetical protein
VWWFGRIVSDTKPGTATGAETAAVDPVPITEV